MQQNYLGDASAADWILSGTSAWQGSNYLLTMPRLSGGSVLASTHYIWYGKVTATIKSSRDQGVVSSAILISDAKDEIDYEFVGADLTTAQTNYYFEAIPDYTNSVNVSDLSDTFTNWHTYEIDWRPDWMAWIVDGQVQRNKTRQSTWNATSNQYSYPQTPSRVQFSIWPGGNATLPEGTVNWAGGAIDWDSQDIQQYGYYYMQIQDVTVECYSPPSNASVSGSTSYVYTNQAGTEASVQISNKNTILSSSLASGLNQTVSAPNSTTAASSSTSSASPSTSSAVIQGGGANSDRGGSSPSSSTSSTSSSSPSSSSSSSSSGGNASGSGSSSDSGGTSFTQSGSSTSPSPSGKSAGPPQLHPPQRMQRLSYMLLAAAMLFTSF